MNEEPPGSIKGLKFKPQQKTTKFLDRLIEQYPDSIGRQFIPDPRELEDDSGEDDPLAESEFLITPKCIHKYISTILIYTSNTCAANCRHCVRKNLIKKRESIISEREVIQICKYLEKHESVRTIVLSGGDALILPNNYLKMIMSHLKNVEPTVSHPYVLRIGSRIPVVLPSRITPQLVNLLKKFSPVYLMIHVNHPDEITNEMREKCLMLADNGIVLGSQSVLLKSLNDSKEVMQKLVEELLLCKIRPFYLFSCDHIRGSSHWWCDEKVGIEIVEHLRKNCSGMGVFHFVRDTKERKVVLA